MKFQPHDIVRRILPSGTMVGGLMVVIASTHNKYTTVRDAVTGKCYIYRSNSLEKAERTIKIMVSKEDMEKIEATKGIGVFYHEISTVYDKLYANPSRFICFVLASKGITVRKTFQLGKVSRVLRKVGEIRKGYQMVPIKQPMYKLQLIGEL
nr:MAG TPA: hypothetical protein [Bacteriophage sp.]DAH14017.1 MAG TPA: hypothetical protein [Caudoviricetes sp.]DAH37704.1 MAG TPA: hypothetical protein [Caudoviricetes sp.]